MSTLPAVSASHASFAIGATPILRDLDFEISPGAWTFLVGPAGSGKTSILRLAAGDLAPTSGAIERNGAARLVLHETPLDDTKSSRDLVAAAMTGPNESARAEALLCNLGLDAYLNHEPFRLSRGHRRRLEIACALAYRPALLCLDDPFSPMDRAARAKTADVLRRAATVDGLAVLMVSNDPLDALRYADRIMLLTPGPAARIAAIHANDPRPQASPEELQASPIFDEVDAALWDESV